MAGEGVIERSVRIRVASGLQSTSLECTHSGPPTTPTGSTPRGSIVVRAPHVAHPSRGTVAPSSTSIGAHHAKSSRASVLWSSLLQSPISHVDVARATVTRRTSAHAVGGTSSRQGPQTSKKNERRRSAHRGQHGRRGG